MKEGDWRPFEPCLENVDAALLSEYAPYRITESREGYVFQSHDFTQQEARIVAESSKWMNDIKSPTLLPVKETK